MEKVTRLLYSTGGFCTTIGVTVLQSMQKENVEYIDYLLLFSVDGNSEFRSKAASEALLLNDFKAIYHLDEYILDPRLDTVDKEALEKS